MLPPERKAMKAMTTSRHAAMVATMVLALATVSFSPSVAAAPEDEAAIRALEERFAAAFNAGDVNAIMKSYVPDQSLVVFDVVPPRQYLGADAYRKDWADLFAMFKGPPRFDMTDLAITVEGNLGFSRSIQHVSGT